MDFSPSDYPFLGLSPQNCNQDFCQGAKTAFLPNSVDYLHDQLSLNCDDPLNLNSFDYDYLDTFNDVILQDVKLDPVEKNLFPTGQPTNPLPEYSNANLQLDLCAQPSYFDSMMTDEVPLDLDSFLNPIESPVQGCLSPESCPEIQLPSVDQTQPFQASQYPSAVPAAASKITIKLKKFKSNKTQQKRSADELVLPKVEAASVVPDTRMTLRDAISMGEASVILDRLFEQDSDDSELGYITGTAPSSPNYWSSSSICSLPSPAATPQMSPIESDREDKPVRRRKTAHSPSERYLKKKDQNKKAALRYRNKKRQSEDSLQLMLQSEEKLNKTLKKNLRKLKRERNTMKKMLREAFITKNWVAADAFK